MPKKAARRPPRATSPAKLARLEQALAAYSERVAHLEHAIDLNIKRMGAMQAEIDHLRAIVQQNELHR